MIPAAPELHPAVLNELTVIIVEIPVSVDLLPSRNKRIVIALIIYEPELKVTGFILIGKTGNHIEFPRFELDRVVEILHYLKRVEIIILDMNRSFSRSTRLVYLKIVCSGILCRECVSIAQTLAFLERYTNDLIAVQLLIEVIYH